MICTWMDQGVFKKPDTTHPLNNSVALEKGRTPKLTCKTVGNIQDLLLPGAQQHSNHSLLISHFSYSKRKNDCQSLPQTGRREKGPPPLVGGDTAGWKRGVMLSLYYHCIITACVYSHKGRSGAPGTKARLRARADRTHGRRDPDSGCEQRAVTEPSVTHRGLGHILALRALFLTLKPLSTGGRERN